MTQNPMSLENLSDHLKALRESGDDGSSTLVEMGEIVVEQTSYLQWVKRIGFALVVFMTLGIGSIASYKVWSTEQFTVVVDLEKGIDPSQVIADSGGQVLSVTCKDGSVCEVKATTRDGLHKFLEKLRKMRGVRKADLED